MQLNEKFTLTVKRTRFYVEAPNKQNVIKIGGTNDLQEMAEVT